GRRDHPDPRPRRLPARLRRDGGRAAGGPAGRAGAVSRPSCPAPQGRAGGSSFHAHLRRTGRVARRGRGGALRPRRFLDLTRAWRKELAAPAPRRGITAAALAADRIDRAHRKVLKRGAAITPDSPPESLHDLRKRCKELRYLLEFFASL